MLISVTTIYSSNGSTINVVKIEGSLTFRRMMRASHTFKELTASPPLIIDNGLDLRTEAAEAFISRSPSILRAQKTVRETINAIEGARMQDQNDGLAQLAALTAMLVVKEDGVLGYYRMVHDRNLGPEVLLEDLGVRSRRFYKLLMILLYSL